jgi:hypothetical protein
MKSKVSSLMYYNAIITLLYWDALLGHLQEIVVLIVFSCVAMVNWDDQVKRTKLILPESLFVNFPAGN